MQKAIKIASKYVWTFIVREISVVRTCDGKEIKATDCIIKVAITRGNIKWRSFALRSCASSAWQPLLPFYFSLLQASCGGERSRHIYPVGYEWSWVIIVDITLEVNKLGGKYKPLSFYVSG